MMMDNPIQPTIKGRGTAINPPNRFETLRVELDPDAEPFPDDEEPLPPQTIYLRDSTRTVIARNDSPDIPFNQSINPYRGCSHGCAYCYARPGHEYLGFSAGLDFETKIMVKTDAKELLKKELAARSYQPDCISLSGVTDCYQPAERIFRITRSCLELLAECRHPVGIVTKNHLVTRDLDLLSSLAAHNAAMVMVSITTLDANLSRIMEPRTSIPARRLKAVETLSRAGIPVGVMLAPVIPGLTDHEMPAILAAAASAGARTAGCVPLRLPGAVAPIFEQWLRSHLPDRADKVLNRIRSMRGGKLYQASWGKRMQGDGIFAEQIHTIFNMGKKRAGLDQPFPSLSTAAFRPPNLTGQFSLFD